jgi:hypothetical protein
MSNRAEPNHEQADSWGTDRLDNWIQGGWGRSGAGRWGSYDDDFEEVGLLGRERRPHGCGGDGAARRGAAARTLGRGEEREGFWRREVEAWRVDV